MHRENSRPPERSTTVRIAGVAVIAISVLAVVGPAAAQDLEPRAYTANPVGAAFLVAAFSRSWGAVVTDPTLPLEDVQAHVNGAALGFGCTFDAFGKVALVTATLPYAWGEVSGNVMEAARSVARTGLADARIRLSVNLRGNPPMGAREFARAPRRTIVGASLTVSAPTGAYDGSKLINIGSARWAFRPEVGVSVPLQRWDFDAYLGVWLFSDNGDFYPGGLTRTQDGLLAVQGHASYTFRPRLWVGVDGTWYSGGETHVAGGSPGPRINNTRLGVTLSVPAGRQQSIKFAYSGGAIVRAGTDFKTFSAAWQRLWLTRP